MILAAGVILYFTRFHRAAPPALPDDDASGGSQTADARPSGSRVIPPAKKIRDNTAPAGPAVAAAGAKQADTTRTQVSPPPKKTTTSSRKSAAVQSRSPTSPIADQASAETKVPSQSITQPTKTFGLHIKRRLATTEEQLRRQLAKVPEEALDATGNSSAAFWAAARKKGANDPAATDLIKRVIRDDPDLAGLPWRLGKECRLAAKAARQLQTYSLSLRTGMGRSNRSSRSREQTAEPLSMSGLRYQFFLTRNSGDPQLPESIPALQQILTSESPEHRTLLIECLASNLDPKASVALAQRALFDLEPDLRRAALAALTGRPPKEYRQVLLDGLRYPWAPVANHAAEALVALAMPDVVPDLVRLLEEGDPSRPFQKEVDHKPVLLVRELVRINHLRNCFLCHAPSLGFRDPVRGLVPTPDRPLPTTTGPQYYRGGRGMFVRADVTYLRQDFAVLQPVENEGKWPKMQRYDYLVRVRPPTDAERAQYQRNKNSLPLGEQQQAILFALREFTGKDLGSSAKAWAKLPRK